MKATTELRLGPAHGTDLARIASLSQAEIEAGLLPSWTESRIAACRRQRETMVLVARLHDATPPVALDVALPTAAVAAAAARPPAGRFAGFAIMAFGEARAHLNLLAVEPPFQRQGIARRLLRWLEASAIEAGTFDVSLEVRATNHAAQAFYLALGYEATGRVSRYYQGVEDAIRMRRDLRSTPTP